MIWPALGGVEAATVKLTVCIGLVVLLVTYVWFTLGRRLDLHHKTLQRELTQMREAAALKEQRLRALERFAEAQKTDARQRHDGELIGLLESLAEISESVRQTRATSHTSSTPKHPGEPPRDGMTKRTRNEST